MEANVCLVCGKLFADAGGASSVIRHEHHVVPRAFGGSNGPTVMVCTAHHSLLHLMGSRLISGKPYFDLVTHDPTQDQKLLWLATRVHRASVAFSKDPNKRVLVPLSLDGAANGKLARLAKFHSVSRANLVKLLIEREYARMFPVK